jgi:hypothetical protein
MRMGSRRHLNPTRDCMLQTRKPAAARSQPPDSLQEDRLRENKELFRQYIFATGDPR